MAHYRVTIESRLTVPETFRYLATFSNAAEWDPGVLSGAQLDTGQVQPGTRFRLVVRFLGGRLGLTYQVTRHQPPHEVVLTAVSPLLRATDRILVAPVSAGAIVSYQADVRLRGPLSLLDPLMRPGFRKTAGRAAAGLAGALAPAAAPAGSPHRPLVPQ